MGKTICIIGGGPAGSMLAHKVASYDQKVLLYDHKAPWEKPCGGMLGQETISKNPELQNIPQSLINECHEIKYISPRDDSVTISPRKTIPVITRFELNKFLLNLALNSGATFIREKVLNISKDNSQWIIATNSRSYRSDIIVGAEGVNSIVREATIGKFSKKHLAQTYGYILSGIPDRQYITKFLDIEGYLFVISRVDHASVGIGAMLGTESRTSLYKRLDDFIYDNYSGFKIEKQFSALVPTVTDDNLFDKPCCGENWLLIGDAAGHVDPVVGEGIYFALESAKLAAQAILNEDIQSYDELWRCKYGDFLRQRASFRKNLSSLAEAFTPEMFGIMMYDRAIRGFFSKERA